MDERAVAVTAWESLYRAQVAVLRQIRGSFPTDASLVEYDVLFNLSRAPGRRARIRDLNRHLLIAQSSVSRLVDRLAARGLVTKCGDPSDARGTIVELTDDGLSLFRRLGAAHAKAIADRMLGELDADELVELQRLTEKLRGGATPTPARIERRHGRTTGS